MILFPLNFESHPDMAGSGFGNFKGFFDIKSQGIFVYVK